MLSRFACLLLLCAASLSATAQTLRFYATPYRVNEGDAVQFTYVETTNTHPKSAIKSWKWDFNNDGTFDATSTTGTNISATWTATYDATKATNNTQFVLPVLQEHDLHPGAGQVPAHRLQGQWQPRPDRELHGHAAHDHHGCPRALLRGHHAAQDR